MNITKNIISLAVFASLSVSIPIYANQGHGQGNGPGYNGSQTQGPIDQAQQTNSCQLEPDFSSEINSEVESMLQFMGEEEKLARDVYVYLNTIQPHNVFVNIAKAEQQHIESVNKFIEAYDIENLASDEYGVFTNTDLQSLYDALIIQGSTSLEDAFMVGAKIEEVDIKDLLDTLETIEDPAIIQMYTSLLYGSYNHLRAFVNQLESLDIIYQAQGPLTSEQVDEILSGTESNPNMNTANAMDANGSAIASSSCFVNEMTKNSQIVGNNAQFNKTDSIKLSSNIKVNSSDLGKNAKLIAVAGYTSESGETSSVMRNNSSWIKWDGNINSLSYAQQTTLVSEQNLEIFNGAFGELKGQYLVSVGYILDDGNIIYNTQPMRFTVED